MPSGSSSPTLLFVCRHGAAKSALAAELARRRADELGIDLTVESRGLEPDPDFSVHLAEALPGFDARRDGRHPETVTAADVEQAGMVVTFDLEPGELPALAAATRWDGLPAVSEDPDGARRRIAEHVSALLGTWGD